MSIAMPANAITTGQLPVLYRPAVVAPEPTGGRHTFDNPNAISVVQLGVSRCMRGPRAHSAAQVGNRGWRVSTR